MAELKDIYKKFLKGKCTREEIERLIEHFRYESESEEILAVFQQELEKEEFIPVSAENAAIGERNFRRLTESILSKKTVKPIKRRNWLGWVAATIALVLSFTTYLFLFRPANEFQLSSQFGDDVLPGGNRAYITLSSGEQFELDSTQTGLITTNGKHAYIDGTELVKSSAAKFAIIHTPVGGQYHIILPDGSEAWLNAASTLKYPLQFEQGQRLIETTGEVYLEVKPDKTKPFIVQTGDQRIQVLGTAFNVRQYGKENITTLLHGRIAIENPSIKAKVVLNPGEQSRMFRETYKVEQVDPSDYVGWKEGTFTLKDATLLTTCQELERWYGVHFRMPSEFQYNEEALIIINRKEKLSEVLEALQSIYKVDFKIKGREVTIK